MDFSKGPQAAVSQCKPTGLASSLAGFLYNWSFYCNLKQAKKNPKPQTFVFQMTQLLQIDTPGSGWSDTSLAHADLSHIITLAQLGAAGEHWAGSNPLTSYPNHCFSPGEDEEQLSYSKHLLHRWSRPLSPWSNGATTAYCSSSNLIFSCKKEQPFVPLPGNSIFSGTDREHSGRQLRWGERMGCGS